ncbi:hypothetical protein WEH80_06095 [Actinomycetes bacterium KLBMP 9759]
MNNFHQHRQREARLLTTVAAIVCALGCASATLPGVEQAITAALVWTGGAGALGLALIAVHRVLRRIREDRDDAVAAARWHAQHTPRLVTNRSDVTGQRSGVA